MKKSFFADEDHVGRNPVLPLNVHIPDGEAHTMPDGKIYVYGSLDVWDKEYCSSRYIVAYSENMTDWELSDTSFDIGKSFKKDAQTEVVGGISVPEPHSPSCAESAKFNTEYKRTHPWENFKKNITRLTSGGKKLYAPDAVYHNGKYYLYFCLSDNSEGVALSDRPTGPFEGAVKLNCRGIDPAVFRDDDGQVYYYWGQFCAKGAKLEESMCRILPETVTETVDERHHFFHEGFSMRKRNGIYYAVFTCTERGRPTCLGYATSTSPLGPFEYKGIIIDNTGCDRFSWNNHGSIEEFRGQWYVFYHRSSQGDRFMRRLCIEPIFFNDDGTIPEVKMTSQGVGKPFVIGETIYAFSACVLTGKSRLMPEKGIEALVDIRHGDSALFRYVQCENCKGKIEMAAEGSATMEVFLNDKKCGHALIKNGDVIDSDFIVEKGLHEMKCVFKNVKRFKLFSIKLTSASTAP